MHENSLRTQVFGWDNESRGHLGAAEAVDQTFLIGYMGLAWNQRALASLLCAIVMLLFHCRALQ